MQFNSFCMRSLFSPYPSSKVLRRSVFRNSVSDRYPGYAKLSVKNYRDSSTYFLHSYKRSALLKTPASGRRPKFSDLGGCSQTSDSQSEVEAEETEGHAYQ